MSGVYGELHGYKYYACMVVQLLVLPWDDC